MNFKKLCLVLTDKCTASCDFCGFFCAPDKQQVMPCELMEQMIDEAKNLGMKSIGFSGGEPFLYPKLLTEGVSRAREQKMNVTIATNGFWGAWDDEKIKDVLEKVKPDVISFSYDFFHKKYVSEEHFMRAIVACSMMGIKTRVYVADMKGDYAAGRFIKSLSNQKYGIEFSIYPVYRTGRAKNLPKELFLTSDKKEDLGCLYANTLSVFYNGDVYPCCRYEAFESALKLGNVNGSTLKDVLESSDVPMICDVLMKSERFYRLLERAKKQGIDIENCAGCSCDYCWMLFGTENHKQKMMPFVEELYSEMLVRSVMNGANENVQ